MSTPPPTLVPPAAVSGDPATVHRTSSGQRRLWFLEQMEPGSPLYHIPYLLRLNGPLDAAALQRALSVLVERHESLRTVFSAVGSEPVQAVRPPSAIELPQTDLRNVPGEIRHERLRQLAVEEARRPFDLGRDLLLRARLFVLGPSEHALMLVMHHIASDGWSMGILYRELGECYGAFTEGREPALPEPGVRYTDFAEWQHDQFQGESYERLASFWKRTMAGAPALLELPTDRPRSPVRSNGGQTVSLRIPAELGAALRAVSSRHRVTLFMTLLAGFDALLHRYSGSDDIVVGTPLAGRDSAETENVVGFFINTMILRADLSGDPSVATLLSRVRDAFLAAFDHREMPYERLVEELQPRRNLSFDPVCQVFFALQNMPTAALKLRNLEISIEPVYTGTSKSDLTAWAIEAADGSIEVTAEFATDLFSAETVLRMLVHYRTLLSGMAADSECPVSRLPLLAPDERRRMVVDWNATAADYDTETCLPELFAEQARRTPGAVALVHDDEEITYSALAERSSRLARRLRARGVGPDVPVAICAGRSIDIMVGLLAIHQAGGAYLPLDPSYPKERLAFMLEDSGAEVLLTQTRLLPNLPPHKAAILCIDTPEPASAGAPAAALPRPAAMPENLAYVLYTSGSTGNPKGVMVTHRNVVNFFCGMDRLLRGTSQEEDAGAPRPAPSAYRPVSLVRGAQPGVWLAVTSISFDISVLELFWTLCHGFKVVILDDSARLPGAATASPRAPAKKLDFSLFYFASEAGGDAGERYRLLLDGARFADARGFKAVWTPERHFHSFGGLYPNPAVAGAALAAITEKIAIRAGSVVSPLHHPARIAEEWSLVDNLSRGRVGISFANGWHDRDFLLNPANFAGRREVMRRNIDEVRRLWRGEELEFAGGRGNPVRIRTYPRPVQKELPVWITAAGNPDTFRLAGETGAGVLTHLLGQEPADLGRKIGIYREARRAAGFDDGCVTVALHTFVGEDLDAVKEKVRGPLCRYLADSADLLRGLSQALYPGADMRGLSAEEMNALVEYSFNRYFELCGLLGTPETCQRTLDMLAGLGADEIACLVDFGVPAGDALSALEHLDRVKNDFNSRASDGKPARQARSLVEQIQRHGVTHLQCTPSFARLLAGSPETIEALRSLSHLLVGGEALPVDLARQLASDLPGTILNMYGPTETTIWSLASRVNGQPNPSGVVDIGRPLANQQAHVLDSRRQLVPAGVPGELWIGGDGVARGYWRRPELTDERFTADPFRPGGRLYRTGDLVRRRTDGTIDFLGRVDQQVKLRGHRIELGEIEAALMRHESVRQAVVSLRTDDPGDPKLVAYVVPAAEPAPAADALRELLRARLPAHMVPSAFVTIDKLPLTPNGKVDRRSLPAPSAAGAPSAGVPAAAAPQAGREQAIAAIWRDILKTDRIGVDDNFFDFGGHSLQVVQVQNRLRESLGVDVPVIKLFQFPTIRALARYLGEQSPPRDDSFRRRIAERNRLVRQAAGRRPLDTIRP